MPLSHAVPSAAAARRLEGASAYRVDLASTPDDIRAAQALRFAVFNLELDEGLVHSYDTGLDADPYDAVCDHLIVREVQTDQVVGTYRMQTGRQAAQGLGYYSAQEFDFAPFEAMRGEILELGRACIHRQHRHFAVLNLLWTGIARHAQRHGTRYLLGCSSLTSQRAAEGQAAFDQLRQQHLAPAAWQTLPLPAFTCGPAMAGTPAPRIPRLLSAYLQIGARICGAPAIDRGFRTIDFLTWLDTESPTLKALQARGRFTA